MNVTREKSKFLEIIDEERLWDGNVDPLHWIDFFILTPQIGCLEKPTFSQVGKSSQGMFSFHLLLLDMSSSIGHEEQEIMC